MSDALKSGIESSVTEARRDMALNISEYKESSYCEVGIADELRK